MARRSSSAQPPRGDKRSQIVRRMMATLDMTEPQVVATLRGRGRQSLRINPLAPAPVEETRAELATLGDALLPIPWCPDAFHIASDKAVVTEGALFAAGRVFIQNASSFVPVLALDPQPGEDILDLCAAPGGKSSHIAALTGNAARLWLNDGIAIRLPKLREVIDLLGVVPDRVTSVPAQFADREIDRTFDRILVDAQCSGEGMIDLSSPHSYRFWTLERVEKYSHLQRKMLMAAYRLLRPGGVLVYSTCTFAPEENELAVNHLVRHRPDITIEPLGVELPQMGPGRTSWEGARFDETLALSRRVLPSDYTEGFFACRLRKAG